MTRAEKKRRPSKSRYVIRVQWTKILEIFVKFWIFWISILDDQMGSRRTIRIKCSRNLCESESVINTIIYSLLIWKVLNRPWCPGTAREPMKDIQNSLRPTDCPMVHGALIRIMHPFESSGWTILDGLLGTEFSIGSVAHWYIFESLRSNVGIGTKVRRPPGGV